ncbi:MAG: glycoside hydrolase family 38 N-terminal domain-containing protein [Armatimonadota bacterium]
MRLNPAILCALILMTTTGANADMNILETSKVKTIYIMQFSHLDIGYTHTQADVAKISIDTLDNVLKLCKTVPDYKWTVESLWQLEQWMDNRSSTQIDELMGYVKSGRIGLTACYAGLHSGLMGYEEFCRYMYLMDRLRVKYGVHIDTAIQNDIPGFTWAYPQALQKSGIKYMALGINVFIGSGAEIPVKDRPFYWEGPDGSRVLTFIAHDPSIGGSGYLNALLYYGWSVQDGRADETVPAMLENLKKTDYPYDALLVMSGGKGDNQNTNMELMDAVHDWNARHQTPKMVVCTPNEFFEHITTKYGTEFPVYRGDWSGLWEQVKESLPYGSGLARITHDSLPIAESLTAVNDVLGRRPYPRQIINDAWENLVTWEEHSGGGSEPRFMTRDQAREDSAVKLRYASDAYNASEKLKESAIRDLASSIGTDGESIVVWNPMPTKRNGIARVKTSFPMSGKCLVDTETGKTVPFQKDEVTGELLFKVLNIPGLGYRTYNVIDSSEQIDSKSGVKVSKNRIENSFVRVDISEDGLISSIYDKKLQREFVQQGAKFGFGQLVSADDRQIGITENIAVPLVKPSITIGMNGPTVGSLIIEGDESPLKRMEVMLKDGDRAVYVKHVIDKNSMPKANLRYDLAFPLDIPDSRFVYDTPTGLFDPQKDRMPKAFPIVHVNHGGVISNKDFGMTISTKQAFNWEFGKLNSWWGGKIPPESTLLMTRLTNNADFYEFKEGQGEYMQEEGAPSIRAYESVFLPHEGEGKFSLDKSMDFLLSESSPFVAAEIPTGSGKGFLPGQGQMLKVKGDEIAFLVFKKAEDDDGYIFRLMEMSGAAKDIQVSSGILKIKSAELLDMVERKVADLPVKRGGISIKMKPREIATLRLRVSR